LVHADLQGRGPRHTAATAAATAELVTAREATTLEATAAAAPTTAAGSECFLVHRLHHLGDLDRVAVRQRALEPDLAGRRAFLARVDRVGQEPLDRYHVDRGSLDQKRVGARIGDHADLARARATGRG